MAHAADNTPGPDPQDLATDTLVRMVLEGRSGLFEHVVRRYQADVHKLASMLLLDRSATEDIVQEVFVKAFTRIDQYRTGEGFGRWLRGIARNEIRQLMRTEARYRVRLRAYAELVETRLALADDGDEELDERLRVLRGCMDKLDDDAARAIRLRYMQAMAPGEVAAEIGKTNGATRTWLHRIREQLRRCMSSNGGWVWSD